MSPLIVIPFVSLLILIITGPLFFEKFWHKNYPKISILLALIVVAYYLISLNDWHNPLATAFEYLSFVIFLTSLFVVSGGIYIHTDKNSTPFLNILFLTIGSLSSNLIGTTGAAMLLIRPYVRFNKYHLKPYHIVFFIFTVCNLGGSLTPIGDPPLILGFFKGVPFTFTMIHVWPFWILSHVLIFGIFYFLEKKNRLNEECKNIKESGKIYINGKRNIIWIFLIVLSVFITPETFPFIPTLHIGHHHVSFVREIIQVLLTLGCYQFRNKNAYKANDFTLEPMKEVVFLFIGLFMTMMPVLSAMASWAASPTGGSQYITTKTLYWFSGLFSAMLDNAPTYLCFLTGSLAKYGKEIHNVADVMAFSNGEHWLYVLSVSLGSVFFGAMTYIGNGPNFMVKTIAEETNIKMPDFVKYITHYSIPYLLPILIINYLLLLWIQV